MILEGSRRAIHLGFGLLRDVINLGFLVLVSRLVPAVSAGSSFRPWRGGIVVASHSRTWWVTWLIFA